MRIIVIIFLALLAFLAWKVAVENISLAPTQLAEKHAQQAREQRAGEIARWVDGVIRAHKE